jgi:hypothetical protein
MITLHGFILHPERGLSRPGILNYYYKNSINISLGEGAEAGWGFS